MKTKVHGNKVTAMYYLKNEFARRKQENKHNVPKGKQSEYDKLTFLQSRQCLSKLPSRTSSSITAQNQENINLKNDILIGLHKKQERGLLSRDN